MPILTKELLVFLQCEQTGYAECYIASWIWRILPFLLFVFGSIGNILNITVLSRKQLRKKPTCVYLIFLAVTDTTVLIFGAFVEILRNVFRIHFYLSSAFTCIFTEWIIHAAAVSSCWFIVIVTVERALLTVFPTSARSKLTPRNAVIASTSIVTVSALLNGHLLYAYTLTEVTLNETETNETQDRLVQAFCSLRGGAYTHFYNTTWSIILFVTTSLLPIILIVTGNTIVVVSLIKRRQALRRIQGGYNHNSTNARQQSRNAFGKRMSFILSGVFIGTTIPYCLYFVHLKYNIEIDGHTLAKYQLLSVGMKCIAWSNFSFNFLLYFMTGSLFKREFKKMLESARKKVRSIVGRSTVHPAREEPET